MMNRARLIKILLHPFTIGMVISIPVLVFALPEIPRYRATVEERVQHGERTDVYYADLDNDRISEKINVDWNPTMLKIMVSSGPRLIDQYNFLSRPLSWKYLNTGDYNRDGFGEIYLFTQRNDSVFLSVIDPFVRKTVILRERTVFFHDTIAYELDYPQLSFFELADLSGDGIPEAVFGITSGYSKRPRNVFCYDILSDSLFSSPLSAATIMGGSFCDLDSDAVPEILLQVNATGNYNTVYPYNDYSSWLMVLDRDLQFRFPPLEFKGFPAVFSAASIMDNGKPHIVALHEYYGREQIRSGLYVFDGDGGLVRSKELEIPGLGNYYLSVDNEDPHSPIFLVNNPWRRVTLLNPRLEVVDQWEVPALTKGSPVISINADRDQAQEHIFRGEGPGTLVIFRNDFRHPLVVDLDEDFYPTRVSKYMNQEEVLLYLDFEEAGYFLDYGSNGWYFAKFPLAAAFYVAVSLLIMLIYRMQRYRAERQYQTQRRISELQILSLKNQIDPHFTFNILNSLGHLYTSSDLKERSYELFVKYSKLLRQSVENSDRISVSLRSELDFVNTYIELEQLRSHPPFQYLLEVGDEVNPDRAIPRMLIHTFVENSIKHGIHQRSSGSPGALGIRISSGNGQTTIVIRDNGPGLHPDQSGPSNISGSQVNSTGKGLKIIDEMIGLFDSLEGVKIRYTMEEQIAGDGSVEGMEVRISL